MSVLAVDLPGLCFGHPWWWCVVWGCAAAPRGDTCQTCLMLKENKTFWSKVYRTSVAKEPVPFLAASLLCPQEMSAWLCGDRAPAGRSGPCVPELTVLRADASSTQIIKPALSVCLFFFFPPVPVSYFKVEGSVLSGVLNLIYLLSAAVAPAYLWESRRASPPLLCPIPSSHPAPFSCTSTEPRAPRSGQSPMATLHWVEQ